MGIDAANDVVAGLQLWHAFDKLAVKGSRAVPLNPAQHSVNFDPTPTPLDPAQPSIARTALETEPQPKPEPKPRGRAKLPRVSPAAVSGLGASEVRTDASLAAMPKGLDTLELFRLGWSLEQIARRRNVKPDTAW